MSEPRELTAEERDRLAPVLRETEIPIRVVPGLIEVEEFPFRLSGQAVGWRPGDRRILLAERTIERLTDTQLIGVVAHEVAHHRSQHVLLGKLAKLAGCLVGLTLFGGGIGAWILSRNHWMLVGMMVALLALYPLLLLWSCAVSRHFELTADRRAAALLGSTEPLAALCEPRSDLPRPSSLRDRWIELCHPSPHPRDRCAALEDLDADR